MIKLEAKRFELNFLLKLSDLKSNFTLTLGYLNPALNNPGQVEIGFSFISGWLGGLHEFSGPITEQS